MYISIYIRIYILHSPMQLVQKIPCAVGASPYTGAAPKDQKTSLCVRQRDRECVHVCVRERARIFVRRRKTKNVWERESVCVCERERKKAYNDAAIFFLFKQTKKRPCVKESAYLCVRERVRTRMHVYILVPPQNPQKG